MRNSQWVCLRADVQTTTDAPLRYPSSTAASKHLSVKRTGKKGIQLVFIDSAVDNYSALVAGVLPGVEVFLLHPDDDGVDQISSLLSGCSDVAGVHIVAHGSSGRLRLGNTWLDVDELNQHRAQLQRWREALADDAKLLLYGCQVAAGRRGMAFVEQIKTLVGAEVAASTTPIGQAEQGGNWDLDLTTAAMEVALIFHPETLTRYTSVLADILLNEDFSGASGETPPTGWTVEVIDGDATIDVWRFDNPGDRDLPSFLTDPVAIFDSDYLSNNDLPENVALVSPVFDASGESQLYLKFDQEYLGLLDPDFGSEAFIEVFDGTTWQVVADQLEDAIAPTTIDISDFAAGVADTQVRFRWTGNWSYYWSVDNVQVVDELEAGVRVIGNPGVSEDNVPDPLNFQFVLDKPPMADVTVSFTVDASQLQPIDSLTFTPDNWNIPQVAVVAAVADGIAEGNAQTSPIQISVTSADSEYDGLVVEDAIASITDSAIPGFLSYRTVEKTLSDMSALAANNSDIASWLDIGDSYDKVTPEGAAGYDINVLELTNKSINPVGGKPVLYVEAGIHAREYSTNEVATRFAEQLVTLYGVDADVTWLLDYFQIDILPVTNPDGRKFAEQGYLWRKNTNTGDGTADFPSYGVDLNRNHDFEWGEVPGGSSDDPFSEVYRGESPASEPETQAVENFVATLFPDQKGPDKTDAAPDDTTGVFIDLHSFGNTVLYPWGSTEEPAPNKDGLRNLGLKFGYYTDTNGTPYDIYQGIGLYPTDGTTDDWAYGRFGIASYTWELGTTFFESSEYFEESIAKQSIAALLYAAKSAYRPYQTSDGPDSVNVKLDLPQVVAGTSTVVLRAIADDGRYADSNADGLEEGTDLPAAETIVAARYSIDNPSWIPGVVLYELTAADGRFDRSLEGLTATIDTTGLTPGRHTIFVESQDAGGSWGVPTAVFLDVLEAPGAILISGNNGANRLQGTNEDDVVYGRRGNDTIHAKFGDDIVSAGAGNDTVRGGRGADLIYGGASNDYLNGGAGNDKLYGEAGRDHLVGQGGDDLLWGGQGNDALEGGKGNDTYVLAFGEGTDTIYDFEAGTDLIGLAGRLSFGQLLIEQSDSNTLISFQTETLAILQGVTDILTDADFTAVT